MQENNIAVLNTEKVLGKDFTVYGDKDNPLFLAKDVADMIEHSNVSSMLKSVDEDEKVLNNVYTPGGSQEAWFLTEYGLYEVLMQSRKPIAKEFKREVKEILRRLRMSGVVITESATQEAIDFNSLFGKYRIRRSVRESNDRRQLLDQFIGLSGLERLAGRMTNKDRINSLNIFEDEIRNILADSASNMRGSELLALQELLTDISKEKNVLSNRANGGIKSNQTKRIRQLEEENQLLKNQLDDSDDNEDDNWYLVLSHPFSVNYMYSYVGGKVAKSAAYHRWINNLCLEKYLPAIYPGVDFTAPIRITLLYGHKEGMDTTNFNKSIIDQLASYYDFDDSLVVECWQSLHEHVNSYNDGYMYIRIENI